MKQTEASIRKTIKALMKISDKKGGDPAARRMAYFVAESLRWSIEGQQHT